MKKKLLALFLALTMAVSLVTPAFAAGGMVTSPSEVLASTPAGRAALLSAWDFEVFQKDDLDKAVEEATVNLFEKTQIMLGELDIPGVDFQWQIAVPDQDLWVDIQGEDKLGLDLSYAKVASLLNEDGEAQVRCEVSLGSLVFQGPIITVDVDEDAKPESEPVEEKEPVVLKGPEVIIHDSQPAEPEEPEAEEPAPESPAPEAPVVPPAQQEPEVVPEVVPEEPVVVPEEPATELDRSALDESVVAVYNHRAAPLTASTNLVVADTNDENNPTYNVVINYVFENNEIVADPYTANLAAGSNFSATVNFPKVQGYLPYVGDAQQNSIDLNYTAISQDYTINVVYKPTNVNYTVIHYKQNVGDDNYTEAERETKQGLTNSTVPEVANTYEGFYALLYEKPKIAADGSTIVEIYYDRYYYLMNFDLDGGYGVEPIYARYGADLGTIPTPTKAGYIFAGWSETEGGTPIAKMPTTMPAENTTYYAIWTPEGTATVNVVFWGENANNEEYSYQKSVEISATPNTQISFDGNGVLTCGYHTHDADCYTLVCTQTPHAHSESCYTCKMTNHAHDTSCYANVGDNADWATRYLPDNYSEGQVYEGDRYTYIYIAGHWYEYTGNTASGSFAPTTCGKTVHTHVNDCIGCGIAENNHKHTAYTGTCYGLNCDKDTHTHVSGCYTSVTGMESSLWTFVSSDEVTVAADGSSVVNVYYDRVEYTVNFYTAYDLEYEYTDYRITAKWGANILNDWPTHEGSSSWYVAGKSYTWQNSIQIMPVGGAKFYGPNTGSSSYKAYYYVEALPGDTDTFEYKGDTYKLHHFDTSSSSGDVTDEERYGIEGFTYKEGTANGESYNNAKFYYTRNVYDIKFYNPTELIKTENDVPYESNLGTYHFTPAANQAPAKYEPGSVVFEGWYLNPECTGEKYILANHTMPAGTENGAAALSLYAKWVPVEHTVTFYLDRTAYDAGTELSTHPAQTVTHGELAEPVDDPDKGDYSFIGWFYMDGDTEKAFDFENMPVNKDLKVYGKWSSNVLKNYTVYYKIQGTDTEIADPTTGSALAGNTKTFEALGGKDLYEDYQEGYFPLVKSHSLTIDINATEEKDTNVYTFWYVQKEAVPYTVKYLNKETGDPVAEEKTVSGNRKAVVTETFKSVTGYMPDAYQKRLVVDASANAKNEIIFYYTKDTEHAYYKITHYIQNTDGENWTEYASSEAVGDIGETYTAKALSIDGFTYDSSVNGTVTSGELTTSGLELKLYYTRNLYPYQVRYLEENTGKQLADPKKATDKYGQVVSESAIAIKNYTAVAPTSQTLNIRIEESQTEAKLNIITFYYKENEVTINYQVVGPNGCGSVSPASETVKVLSGTASGSTATASDGYKFVGWYSDKNCTKLITENQYCKPTKAEGSAWVDGTTYYAKFEYDRADLTITKTCNSLWDSTQSFLFTVTGSDGFSMDVTVQGNGSVTIKDLPIGTYTVTEQKNWSWRYTANSEKQEITLSPTKPNTVSFTNDLRNSQWLSGTAREVNNWALKFPNN